MPSIGSGSSDLGQGFFKNAGVPANGAIGTGTQAGNAEKGAMLIDTTNAQLYLNNGTLASPVWKQITRAA
jgi:hypothetical protein